MSDSDIDGVEYGYEEPAVEEPVRKKRPAKAGRLAGVALLALVLVVAAVMLVPSLRKELLPQRSRAVAAPADSSPENPGLLPAVPLVWVKIDHGDLPADVAQDLNLGKYYYDKRLPGNFGLAIHHWKQALARHEGTERDDLQLLVESAEEELALLFSADSVDVFVMLKQGKRAEAVRLLEKMRANYLEITAPQYAWASLMLYRNRRRR